MADVHVTLADGRTVGLNAFGDPVADRLLVICHPAPGSSAFDPDPLVTNRWGLHLIGLDRPGYGGSEPLPAGSHHALSQLADDVADLVTRDEQVADRISNADMEHCGVIGWGAGAVVAAALAVRHPDLVDRLALVSAPSPEKAERLARRPSTVARGRAALGIAEDDPALARHLGLDRRLDRMLEEAFVQGDAGLDGDRALLEDTSWVDGLHHLDAQVLVVAGAEDPGIDADDLRWWRRRLPRGARVETIDGSASLTIADAWETVLAHVAPAHGHIPEHVRDHGVPILPDLPPTA